MSASGSVFFSIVAAIAVLSAFGAIASRTPIRAAMALLLHIISLAGMYLSLYAELLAAIQLIVYAGAVVVLFVFVIMLIGPTEEPETPGIKGIVPRAVSLCLMAAVALSVAGGVGHLQPDAPLIMGCPEGVVECSQFGGVKGIAEVLYRNSAVPFELVSILLLVAILGAIAVARGRTVAEAKVRNAARVKEDAERSLSADVSPQSGS